ncbi:MAG: prepilin peptidase [Microthrixaceae bacterium]
MTTSATVLVAVFGALVGACVGSFTCVVIDRLPLALDEPNEFGDLYDTRPWPQVLGGRSRCDSCGEAVRPRDNVPVLGWLLLRGRCRDCGERFGAFHPVVEVAVPAVGLLMWWGIGSHWQLLPVLWLVPVGIAVAVIDLRTLIVPTRIVWPALAVSVVLSLVAAFAADEPGRLWGGLLGVAALAGPLFVLWFVHPRGMGFGDVRMAVLLGWTVGFVAYDGRWAAAVFAAVVTLGVGALLGLPLALSTLVRRGWRAVSPFGPSLVAATLLVCALAVGVVDLLG